MCHIGTWSTRYCMRTAEKVWRSKVKKIWFAECPKITLGKSPLCRVSGEDTRQRVNDGGPLPSVLVCRVPDTRQTWSLSSVIVCRVLGTRQTTSLPSASSLPSAFSLALGRQPLCRVPDKKHSAKSGTLGKEAVSGSVLPSNTRKN